MKIEYKSQLIEEREKVKEQARRALTKLNELNDNSLNALYQLKFEDFGFDPLNGRPLNLIEQLNQSFHALAVFATAEFILDEFKDCGTLTLSPQIDGGVDVRSAGPIVVAAEVFATVSFKNNNKLYDDAKSLKENVKGADHRFVCFYDPTRSLNPGWQPNLAKKYRPVKVYALSWKQMIGHGETC